MTRLRRDQPPSQPSALNQMAFFHFPTACLYTRLTLSRAKNYFMPLMAEKVLNSPQKPTIRSIHGFLALAHISHEFGVTRR
ncbi:hypothetical protein XELAEV_18026770mg [Xenopus laevis]|uniref:Uncharacterized protein n=1 Tax=Xenopus laevis TaxID=8355 RepID=A0A974HJ59_XENLA|nr:hypothetical protein XELAEV_18026770mg [Xenopus laevis]